MANNRKKQNMKDKQRKYGIMREDVQLLGTGLKLQKGELVVITPTTNLPDSDGRVYARPRGGIWDSLKSEHVTNRRSPEVTILIDIEGFVSVTSKQKRAYLMLCKRWESKPQAIEPEFMGLAVMVRFPEMWIGIEPDGYAHS